MVSVVYVFIDLLIDCPMLFTCLRLFDYRMIMESLPPLNVFVIICATKQGKGDPIAYFLSRTP